MPGEFLEISIKKEKKNDMPRSLLPPKGVYVPPYIAYDTTFSPAARDTYMQLRGLAWGKKQTPPLTMDDLSRILGKSPSTIYGHLAYLRDRRVLGYDAAGDKMIKVFFIDEEDSGILEKPFKPSLSLTTDDLNQLDQEERKDLGAFQNSGKIPVERKPSKRDPRTDHPAIQCVKGITSRYPQKELYDDLIRTVGDKPDIEKLLACRKEWLKRGYNPNALTWALEWYKTGIPDRFSKNGKTHQQIDWIKELGGAKRVKALFENGNLSEYEIGAHRQELISIGINPDDYVFEEDTDAIA